MKKIIYGLLATLTGLVLLFSYRTSLDQGTTAPVLAGGSGVAAAPKATASRAPSDDSATSGEDGTSGASGSSSGTSGTSGTSTTTASGYKSGTFTGQSADTPYGPLQVQISVSGGKITAVNVPVYPNGSGLDQQINSYALPQLVQETQAAQSARIDMVSGATYTSQGYAQSLQSALDQAKA